MRNDLQIQRDVLAQLDEETNITNDAIGVEVHHGVVKLAGHVREAGMRQIAERAARRVTDVRSVVIDIDVAGGRMAAI